MRRLHVRSFVSASCSAWLLVAALLGAQAAAGQENKEETKAANKGTIQIGAEKFLLSHAIAYETKFFFGKKVAVVVMTEKAMPEKALNGLKAALARDGEDGGSFWSGVPTPYIKMTMVPDQPPMVNVHAGGGALSSNVGFESTAKVADGRVRGRVFMPKKREAFGGKEFLLDVTFDVPLLQVAAGSPEPKPTPPKKTVVKPKTPVTPSDRPPVAAGKEQRIEGKLTNASPKIMGRPAEIHVVKMSADKTYIIDMESVDFDAYLRILDSNNQQLASDDDGGGKRNARLRFTPPRDGEYQIAATRFGSSVGNYVLRIRVLEEDTTPAKAHDVGKDGLKFDGSLSAEDKKDRARTNSYAKTYLVNMVKGQDYLIELDSGAFDAYLRVEDRAGKQLAFDDDGGDDTNARLVFTAPADGAYRIIVTSFENARTGAFALRVSAK